MAVWYLLVLRVLFSLFAGNCCLLILFGVGFACVGCVVSPFLYSIVMFVVLFVFVCFPVCCWLFTRLRLFGFRLDYFSLVGFWVVCCLCFDGCVGSVSLFFCCFAGLICLVCLCLFSLVLRGVCLFTLLFWFVCFDV